MEYHARNLDAVDRLDDVEYISATKNLIKLKRVGHHICLFADREHRGNNPYLIRTGKGYYYRCHDDDCKGKELRIRCIWEPEDF